MHIKKNYFNIHIQPKRFSTMLPCNHETTTCIHFLLFFFFRPFDPFPSHLFFPYLLFFPLSFYSLLLSVPSFSSPFLPSLLFFFLSTFPFLPFLSECLVRQDDNLADFAIYCSHNRFILFFKSWLIRLAHYIRFSAGDWIMNNHILYILDIGDTTLF